MILSKIKELEDRIVELVASSKMSVKSLHALINEECSCSERAVYKAVNRLINAGVLLKVGKHVMLDQEWASRAVKVLEPISAPSLSNGERAVYTFTSMEHLDAFWKTVVLPLERISSAREIFFYNPHNFWAYLPARRESEDAYYRHFADAKRHGFFTVGEDSRADSEFKREYQDEYLQVDLRDVRLFRRTDHITILGSFVIVVRLAKGVSERIDKLYASGEGIKDILPEIVRLCAKPGKIRFVIENNSVKAAKIRKVLARNFYFNRT